MISAPVVVNAGGPWAIEIGRWVGVDVPILNSARSIVVTQPFPDIPSDLPFLEDLTLEWYCRPEGPGMLMGMGAAQTARAARRSKHAVRTRVSMCHLGQVSPAE